MEIIPNKSTPIAIHAHICKNPDKQPRKQARSEEGQTTFLSTKMVTEKK